MITTATSLDLFAARVRDGWGPLTSDLAAACRAHLADLLRAPAEEPWLASLRTGEDASRELYRDPVHGFVLLAHHEPHGLYRPPHDHGRGWVIYGVQQGEMEMSTYARITDADGSVHLVKRDTSLLRAGDVRVYLPGDIHDTRCVAGPALQFRFTERDLRHEDQVEHRITRYAEQGGRWVPASA